MKLHYKESTVEWLKHRIKSEIRKERKQKTLNPNRKKKNTTFHEDGAQSEGGSLCPTQS